MSYENQILVDMAELTEHEFYEKNLWNYLQNLGSKSGNTWSVYRCNLYLILQKFPEPKKATLFELQGWVAEIKNDNTRKNICVMIRWLFNKILGWDIKWFQLPYPKYKKKIQPVYSLCDILKVLNAIPNEKQKAILALIIDCGLRISEPCAIFISDCNSKERRIVLRSAKGDNDRSIFPSKFVWDLIKDYWNKWEKKLSDKFLFDGMVKGMPYSSASIRGTLKRYCKFTGVKYLGVHAIRRFTGTWWIENDVPLPVAAQKMGHSSSRTLEQHYLIHSHTYLKNVPSPLNKIHT